MSEQKFEQWAIVELFGHQRIAGRVTEQTIGGSSFVRVDVPPCESTEIAEATQPFTKLFGQGAIYAISFVDEAAAKYVARQIRAQPIDTYSLKRALTEIRSLNQPHLAGLTPDPDDQPPF